MSEEKSHYRICPLCEACCGLEVRTRGTQVLGIRGAADDVFSRGYLCPKGVALKDLHEDPDRLRTPLVKRNGRFEPAGWDEAFAEIEHRLAPLIERHGRDALALAFGNPSAHKYGVILYVSQLARMAGTKNVYSASTLDQMPKQLSSGLMFGHWLSVPVPDIDRSRHLLVIGANPIASNGSMWSVPDFRGRAKALRARGGKLVVIDPRRSETAAVADEHHFIRPGTDALLLAAMVHTLFDEGLVRPGRLAGHVSGLEALRPAFTAFAPERVAVRCGIVADRIRTLARELAAADGGCIYGRIGTCTQRFGTVASWLIDVLNVLTGQLDREGGAMFARAAAFAQNTLGRPGSGRGVGTGRHQSRVSGAPEVFGELPITCLAEEIETAGAGQVRALITVAGNPVLSSPGGERLARALETLDFMVAVDIYVNETTRHADVILPGRSPLEESHYDVALPQLACRNHARFSPAVFEPESGHLPEWQVLLKLGAIVQGLGAAADPLAIDDAMVAARVERQAGDAAEAVQRALGERRGPERLLELALRSGPDGDGFGARPEGLTLDKVAAAPGGIDLGPLRPRIPEVLRTPSGRIELAPSMLMAELPELARQLELAADPLVVVGRRDVRSNNSWMHNLPTLAKGPERCTALVHPADAARAGVQHGQRVTLTSDAGEVSLPLEVSDTMMEGVVCVPHGWGHDLPESRLAVAAERPGVNLNRLLSEELRDPLSGNAVLSGVAVRLSAAA